MRSSRRCSVRTHGEGKDTRGAVCDAIEWSTSCSLNTFRLLFMLPDDAAWQPEPENSSSSFSFSFSAPDPTPAVDPATLPPVPLLFLYNLEYAHLVAEGELPRRIEAHLAQRGEAGRKYVVAVARVEQEQGRTEGPAGPAPVTTCATGGACCKSSAAPPAAAATSCGCATPSAECAPASVTSPSTSIAASPSSPSSPPLVFSSPSALPSSSEPLESFYLNGYSFSLPHSLASSKDLFQRVQVVWIGSDSDYQLLTNCMLVYNSNTFHLYNPSTKRLAKEIKSKSKTLARRYYLMEKAKNADIVGILVGTLGVGQLHSQHAAKGHSVVRVLTLPASFPSLLSLSFQRTTCR